MEKIELHTKSRPSTVYCGEGAFAQATEFLRGKDIFVVTDSNVFKLYESFLKEHLPQARICVVPAGERNKNRSTLFRILDAMIDARLHRSSVVVAFGGGVVGDMGGFAAALYMRGTRLVQIPTTLLAQVDSSVGGKTAIDYRKVKNVLGAFYQPEYVFCDPYFLKTLPRREIKCGLGEIIKTAALDKALADKVLQYKDRLEDLSVLRDMVADCVRFKARIVEQDETESSGVRKCLNLGHTTGHALELLFGRRSHGEYVLIGMWLESFIAQEKGVCTAEHAEWVRRLVSLAEPKIPRFQNAERGVSFALLDKKNSQKGSVSVLLSSGKGEYAEAELSESEYRGYLMRLNGTGSAEKKR